MLFVLVNLTAPPAMAVRSCVNTGVPFLINGQDVGYDVEIILSNYSLDYDYIPQFGEEGEAHWTVLDDGTIRVFFHPENCYDTGCQYYLYVGLHDPIGIQDNRSCSGYDGQGSVKGKQVNFTGAFRFVAGEERNRKSFFITPAYTYEDAAHKVKRVCAFNNYGGVNKALDQAYMDHSERDWWHNIYWGTWYDPVKMFPDGVQVPGAWVYFNEDLNKSSARAEALAREKWPNEAPPHFKTDKVVLMQAGIGPEYKVGEGLLVFDVKNLNLDVR